MPSKAINIPSVNGPLQREEERRDRMAAEQERRDMDPLRVYEPMGDQTAFHLSQATLRIFQKGNRGGGSTSGAIEVARAARGLDPNGKYPKGPLRIWIVVYVENNIGRTIYRMLFEPGLFDIVRDPETNTWRAFEPDRDRKIRKYKRPAPALIPEDEIKEWSWKDAKARVFALCRLHNGTEIYAFCSASEPPMGDPIHLAWIDEDLKLKKVWMQELFARTMDLEGCILWTANPKGQNDALQKWVEEAEADKGKKKPAVEVFRLNSMDNKFLPLKSRKLRMSLWLREGEEVARARNTGDFVMDSLLLYPEFSMERHGVPNVLDPGCMDRGAYDHNIDWFLRTCEIPKDWTRFLWIDPGIQFSAAEFFAVPPPEVGDFVVAYDEVYLVGRPLTEMARAVKQKLGADTLYSMGADDHYSRMRDWTQGKRRSAQMSDVFRELGIRSLITGFGFLKGSDDKHGRESMLHSWLAQRTTPDGKLLRPKLCMLRSKNDRTKAACPMLAKQFGLVRKVFQHDEAKDKRIEKDTDTIDCAEYAAHDPGLRYHRIQSQTQKEDRFSALNAFLNPAAPSDGHLNFAPGPSRALN